jgi:cellulose synthase/poly-beta-1,6-N-acetylglucosamine synthase-like glycosyltransferase
MIISIAIFWILLGIVFYTYLGYGLLMNAIISLRKTNNVYELHDYTPNVVHIIAAFNEEDFIEEKIVNAIAVDYPSEKYKIIIVADGSTDKTVSLIEQFPEIELLFQPERRGKMDAINRAVASVSKDSILVFSDANTMLNNQSIRLMVNHYRDLKVGGVSGEKRVHAPTLGSGFAEGLYWKYESIVKQLESDFYTVVGAAGELFSVRKNLFTFNDSSNVLDDLCISLNVCKMGYVVKYEPKAYAIETPSFSIADEQKRKTRISAGAFQSIFYFKELLNVFKYGKLSFQYISHRLFRWTVCPIALPLLFVLNIVFVVNKQGLCYDLLLIGQFVFYGLAALGNILIERKAKHFSFLFVPFYFVFMHLSVWKGFFKFLQGEQNHIWEKARRQIN